MGKSRGAGLHDRHRDIETDPDAFMQGEVVGAPEREVDDSAVVTCEVSADNWNAVSVFQVCEFQIIGGAFGMWWRGIPSIEVKAACELLNMPRSDWPEVLEGVRIMAAETAKLRNDATAAAVKKH
jgi:hypothetical protein